MTFQALNLKCKNFLNLLDEKKLPIALIYIKRGAWLKHFSHSNILFTRALRAIINHASIREYHLQFFPKELFKYPYNVYPIKSRNYILH